MMFHKKGWILDIKIVRTAIFQKSPKAFKMKYFSYKRHY